jgi:hypothetical protein
MKGSVDYEQINKEVFTLLNKARRDPGWVADELSKLKKYYKGTEYRNPNLGFHLLTDEGVKAVDDAIHYLRNEIYPQKELSYSKGLSDAAQKLVDHIGPEGHTSHQSQENSMEVRVKAQITETGAIAENVSFGWSDPQEIVFQLIIDDGVKTRGHRRNIYEGAFDKVGIASGSHKGYQHCCVIDFHGRAKDSEVSFSKYQIDEDEFPEGATSVQKHLEVKTENNVKTVKLTYVFTLADGSKITKTKDFTETL